MIRALFLVLFPVSAFGAMSNSGAAFLKIGTGARPAAMGEAYTALADDVNALYYNPGGLAKLAKKELGATHTEWLLGTKFDFIGYAHPTKFGAFGLGFTRLAAGAQEGRDASRQATAGFDASDTAYTVGYSRKLAGQAASWGTNIKFLQSKIGSYSASSVAMDFGVQHQMTSRPASFGFSVLNVGQGMRYLAQRDPLPLTMSVGTAYRLGGVLQLALDIRHEVPDKQTSVGFGTEYSVLPALSLRAGYSGLGSMGGLGGGVGLKMGAWRADYTFTPFGTLGNVQRISLGARW